MAKEEELDKQNNGLIHIKVINVNGKKRVILKRA